MPGQRDGCRAGTCTAACTLRPRNLLLPVRCLPAPTVRYLPAPTVRCLPAPLLPSLQVARCTKIISPNTEEAKYVINIKQIAKFVVGLGDKVSAGWAAERGVLR